MDRVWADLQVVVNRRGRAYHVENTIAGGNAAQVVHYGRPGDDIYVGD